MKKCMCWCLSIIA